MHYTAPELIGNWNVKFSHECYKYENIFKSSIFNEGNIIATGGGESKKKAEQDVSKKALIHFNVITAF